MTSRLKRKLNDLGVDPTSSKANESFCLIGTPLPPLEKSKDTGEFVPLWKQEVRDEKGRRRLHGAFTGGFSAGYFNTVGSKEGWTPATFTSSRSSRSKAKTARPEDFMDEEDLAELRDSRQLVDENDEMDFVRGGTASELRRRTGADGEQEEEDSITSALASALAPPVQDSVGARILKKMGWRMGQGIGPRLTYDQRRAQDPTFDKGTEVDEEARKHLYPRRDTPLLIVSRKENSHGLGYTPGMGLSESLGQAGSSSQGAQKGPRISAGFGLGALNDADEDDLDVYDSALSTRNNGLPNSRRVAYHHDEADDDDRIAMGRSRRPDQRSRVEERAGSRASGSQTFSDGRPVLKGFVLSDRPVVEDKWFPIPEPPSGWKPDPRRVWDKENVPSSSHDKGKQRADYKSHEEWKRSLLSADERGTLLGETPLPAAPRSVFEFMSAKDRERLERIKHEGIPKPPPQPSPNEDASRTHEPGSKPTPTTIIIPQLHPSIAKAALSGFQPFTSDPAKQSRYTTFLQFISNSSSSGSDGGLGMGPTPNQSIEEFNKELDDYAKAATVFKPLSGAMAGRFRSAVVIENGPRVVEGLHTPSASSATPGEGETSAEEEKKEEDPRMAAVRLGMYGPLTREVKSWQPAKLLCKRFGVKEPEVEVEEDMNNVKAQEEKELAEQRLAITAPDETAPEGKEEGKEGEKKARDLANVGLGEDDTQGADTLTYQRPGMDVFKAIFASDDEDSDVEDKEDEAEEQIQEKVVVKEEVKEEPVPPALPIPQPNEVAEKVDLTTFKPTFVPRSERRVKDKDKDRNREKEKKREKKKKAKTLVSFDDGEGEEGDGGGLTLSVKPEKRKDRSGEDGEGRKKKKKRKEASTELDSTRTKEGKEMKKPKEEAEDEDDMWVEAPPPEVVQKLNYDFGAASGPVPVFGMAVDGDRKTDVKARESQRDGEDPMGPPRGRKRAVDFM